MPSNSKTTTPTPTTRLARKLTTSDAVVLGLGSMIGAGIFSAAGPAAVAAGSGLLIALVLAGCIAYLNASTMAQLAVLYPESGGAYVYGRKRLGPFWGYLAGWGFVIGKLASCTAMALTFGHYAFPEYPALTASAVVLLLTYVNYLGVRKTAVVTRILVTVVLITLAVVVFASLFGGAANPTRLKMEFGEGGLSGLLQATGLLFFAFAGYARVATLGEEVIEPRRTIPRAILIALSLTLFIYSLVMTTLVLTVDKGTIASSPAPLRVAIESGSLSFLSPIVRIGASLASLGVLLSLMAGVSRTIFAMSANGDLPRFLNEVHAVHRVPYRAELLVGATVAILVSVADLRSVIGFSSFAILMYYAVANASSLTLAPSERLWPKGLSVLGVGACVMIAFSLPTASIVGGIILFIAGALIYLALHLRRRAS